MQNSFHQASSHPASRRIAIVGGGIASFIAGIKIREKLPDAEITLLSAAGERTLGGHLASWDEQGYPIEHGLHALFGFYEHVIPILKQIGAYDNFTRSKKYTFVYERGKIHRFDLKAWPATYRGFTTAEKLRLAAGVPVLSRLILEVNRKGFDVFDGFDRYDLREFARLHGVPDSVLRSGFFRQFYEAAFNTPHELSAAVALESIYKIFSKPWHYYFNQPSRQSLIEPLRHYFTHACRGKIQLNQKLVRVRTDDAGLRALGLDFEDLETGRAYAVEADEYVLTLGLEDFKKVDFGPAAGQHDYFRNIHKLETVSSFSIQGWFKEDPVPAGVDSIVAGMPEPFGILCPITRVRAPRPPKELKLPYELIATGPEQGFEDIPDDKLKAQWLKDLKKAGFRIPRDPKHMHVALRRNREPFHRYLLTRPGELHLRPTHQSPLENLFLAGAWVRNSFALPCVDAAAEGAIKAAELIAARFRAQRASLEAGRFAGMPRGAPLVLPPPYRFPRSSAAFFLLDADPKRLTQEISPRLDLFPGLGGKMLFAALRHDDVHAPGDPSGARYGYNEVLLAAFVREKGLNPLGGMGLYPICLYVDDDTAMAAGREVYGFPKKMARIELSASRTSIVRGGRAPGSGPGSVMPIEIMNASWSADPNAGASLLKEFFGSALGAIKLPFSFPPMGDMAKLMAFYNTRDFMEPVADPSVRSDLRQLTKATMAETQVHSVSAIRDLRFKVGESTNDPIHLLTGSQELQASRGVRVELGFTLGTAGVV